MAEIIERNGVLLAIIVSSEFRQPGIHFFTPRELSQQLAYMQHPAGKKIQEHFHRPVAREVVLTQEVLLIRRGSLRVDLYDEEQKYVASRVLGAGDVILLAGGGHGFEALEEVEMFEVKQGPYLGEEEKSRFQGIRPVVNNRE